MTSTVTTITETATSITATTLAPTTTQGPAAVIKMVLDVTVTGNSQDYLVDSRVEQAYKDVMVDITELDPSMIDVDLAADQGDNITVTYAITMPYEDNGDGLVPTVPLDSVEAKLAAVSAASFNEMLDAKITAATGEGTYGQEIIKLEEKDPTNVVSGVTSAFSLARILVLYVALTASTSPECWDNPLNAVCGATMAQWTLLCNQEILWIGMP
eukprot:CAMPEP_0181455210 /NCGR_PEP_ID=MMETSP1110-20121109/30641_1 /TAXON_ID=174948 /ORGANISM="Symbiodinium sp., Strain CCMP421" /LENGTH=212 /DNA_ID=CAMNT_0023579589 /DNA_START=502 /DNA_END=1141 /DNA_ORIENTATION=+